MAIPESMARDPEGRRRPSDVIGNAVHIMQIATGQIVEDLPPQSTAAAKGRLGGQKGGPARAAALSPQKRKSIAKKAAKKRWAKKRAKER